jgi:multicomponent Na+:H+ antiporter subunit D
VSGEGTLLLAPALPLVGALLIVLCGRWPNLREGVSLVTAAATTLTVAQLAPAVASGGQPGMILVEMMPGLSLALAIEPLGCMFALIASFLWLVTTIYSIGYMRAHHEANQTRFYAFFAVSVAAAIGIAFAGNMLTLFVCYEALTLATYPLVTHAGTDEARQGGRTYLGILLGTSIALQLIAVVWTWMVAGTLDFRAGGILAGETNDGVIAALLALYVFGIGKAAVMPFHRWLPAAMVAPTPVSALLHAVAVVKAGVFTVVKVVVYLFGMDTIAGLAQSVWLQYVAAATILIASLVALTKDNLKARLAYSTVSQLGYIVLGAMLATPLGILGSGLHIATHAFGKITLFFCAGAILVAAHKTEVSQLNGIGRAMPWTMGAFAVASISMIGLPPAAGILGKWYLLQASLNAANWFAVGVLIASTLLTAGYLLPIVYSAFFRKPDSGSAAAHSHGEAPWPSVAALTLTAAGTVLLFLFPEWLLRLIHLVAAGGS